MDPGSIPGTSTKVGPPLFRGVPILVPGGIDGSREEAAVLRQPTAPGTSTKRQAPRCCALRLSMWRTSQIGRWGLYLATPGKPDDMLSLTKSLTTAAAAAAVAAGSLLTFAPAPAASAATLAAAPAPAKASAVVVTRERNKRVSRSMRGVRKSAYIGRYYDRRYERTRRCIVRKESGGNYRIKSRGGTYKGAYQFNSYLARHTALKMGRRDLARKPMNKWSRLQQDKAFWIVWNHGRGARNWPTRHGC